MLGRSPKAVNAGSGPESSKCRTEARYGAKLKGGAEAQKWGQSPMWGQNPKAGPKPDAVNAGLEPDAGPKPDAVNAGSEPDAGPEPDGSELAWWASCERIERRMLKIRYGQGVMCSHDV
ncbi:hypothetical protein CRG98_010721 [Punica granatum]|uniref:Uncharacterized protein n=1 Tax=Punica granatum TaxID=22663 RepID=A0A2I0KM22_PUNGR|nr:hypothetical protein CRG98_010721 [Punica granatum]